MNFQRKRNKPFAVDFRKVSFALHRSCGSTERQSHAEARLATGAVCYVHAQQRLQYTVRVSEPDLKLATLMLEQFGGPQGELAAAMRYFTQALSDDDPGRKDLLHDIATEEMSHLEIIGSIFCMLNKGAKGKLAEGVGKAEDLLAEITQGGESHTTSSLYGGGAALVNSAGVPWTAAYVDSIGDPTCDLRSNIAAEARAKTAPSYAVHGIPAATGRSFPRETSRQRSMAATVPQASRSTKPRRRRSNM